MGISSLSGGNSPKANLNWEKVDLPVIAKNYLYVDSYNETILFKASSTSPYFATRNIKTGQEVIASFKDFPDSNGAVFNYIVSKCWLYDENTIIVCGYVSNASIKFAVFCINWESGALELKSPICDSPDLSGSSVLVQTCYSKKGNDKILVLGGSSFDTDSAHVFQVNEDRTFSLVGSRVITSSMKYHSSGSTAYGNFAFQDKFVIGCSYGSSFGISVVDLGTGSVERKISTHPFDVTFGSSQIMGFVKDGEIYAVSNDGVVAVLDIMTGEWSFKDEIPVGAGIFKNFGDYMAILGKSTAVSDGNPYSYFHRDVLFDKDLNILFEKEHVSIYENSSAYNSLLKDGILSNIAVADKDLYVFRNKPYFIGRKIKGALK